MNVTLNALALVALGGALGGFLRVAVSGMVTRRLGDGFPWGTLAVNLAGAFAIGAMAAVMVEEASFPAAWQFAVVGILGSFTTVSSLSLQSLALLHAGLPGRAFANLAVSAAAGIVLAAAGYALARLLTA